MWSGSLQILYISLYHLIHTARTIALKSWTRTSPAAALWAVMCFHGLALPWERFWLIFSKGKVWVLKLFLIHISFVFCLFLQTLNGPWNFFTVTHCREPPLPSGPRMASDGKKRKGEGLDAAVEDQNVSWVANALRYMAPMEATSCSPQNVWKSLENIQPRKIWPKRKELKQKLKAIEVESKAAMWWGLGGWSIFIGEIHLPCWASSYLHRRVAARSLRQKSRSSRNSRHWASKPGSNLVIFVMVRILDSTQETRCTEPGEGEHWIPKGRAGAAADTSRLFALLGSRREERPPSQTLDTNWHTHTHTDMQLVSR